jgi:aconitate hydratase
MLGQPSYFIMPEVIGLKLKGKLPEGATATDLVLAVTQLLRKQGVVGKFVVVFGDGLNNLAVTDRATISNMSPEFGCTITYFPIDDQTINFMRRTARTEDSLNLVEMYCKENMLWRENEDQIEYSAVVELDLSTIEPAVAGPKRPQDRIILRDLDKTVRKELAETYKREYVTVDDRGAAAAEGKLRSVTVTGDNGTYPVSDGAVVIAAITSCTNTSNPSVMIGAGLVAKKAVEKGLQVKPWVKTSLAPGSRVVTKYLEKAGLNTFLDTLHFNTVGYGCTTCIGNSGNFPAHIEKAIVENDLAVASVLSGNRNFEARVHPLVKMNFLASPMLVVVYAIAGRTDIDIYNEPIGTDKNGDPVYMKDIWPSDKEIADTMNMALDPKDYAANYATAFDGDAAWQALNAPTGQLFEWDAKSTYVKEAPFFQNISETVAEPKNIIDAKTLLVLGDSITTDHISPAGSFKESTPAGKYLIERGVTKSEFNSYGARRGNHEVMMRGTFANVRIKNKLATKEGGYTLYHPTQEETTVFEAAEKYMAANIPTIILGGKEYGNGSSRDWAAKGPNLLGVKAVIVESFERIHRSNLAGMGVLPLLYMDGQNSESLGLTGHETFTITGIEEGLVPQQIINVKAVNDKGVVTEFKTKSRLDSQIEVEYYKNGGILNYVLRQFLKA